MASSLLAAPVANPTQATSATQNELIIADGLCPKIAELLPGALHEVVSLGLNTNPVQAITEELAARRRQGQGIDTLHIVAHGRPGAFQIGGQWVDAEAMLANAHYLAQWQVDTIALWSCGVGQAKELATTFSELTGSELMTTTGVIGGSERSSWSIQSSGGRSLTEQPFAAATLQNWPHSLATVTFSQILRSDTNTQAEESNSITTESQNSLSGASNISFSSENPADVTYSGNNVPGTLSYSLDGGITFTSITGVISRQFKAGPDHQGFYFIDANGDFAVGNGETGFAYILADPTEPLSTFASGTSYGTSSDPVDTDLNLLLNEAPIVLDITENDADNSIPLGGAVTYTFKFSSDIDSSTFTASDIVNKGTAGIAIGAITEVSPGVFTVNITGNASGSIQLAIAQSAGILSAAGTALDTSAEILDDSIINVLSAAPLSVTGGDYNEASNAAFFSVTAPQGEPLTLSVLTGDTNLTAGGQPPIRYSTDGGATWQSYTAPFTVPAAGSGSVLVAVDITSEQDDLFEGQETFSLSATSGANSVSGDATINDDGTGTIIPVDADGDPTIINGNPVTDPDGPFDDDRAALSVTGGDYNEASNAAFFSVTAPQGQPLTLSVLTGDTNLTAGGQPPIRYSTDGGATWQSYTAPFTVPAAGSGSVLVAVDITSEQDDLFEGQETFSLSATSGANTVSGDATINDDGTGTIIPVDPDGDPTIDNGNPVTDPDGPFDDDRAALSVTGGDYNEASNAAFFSVTAPQGQPLTLTVVTGDTNLTAGGQPPIRYSTDGGATWQSYTAPFTVPAAGSGSVLVAVDITSEQDDLFEGQETFSLSATSGANSVSGDATINDDGTGTIIPVDADGDPTIINGNPVTDPDGPFDDDRAALSVTGGDYNEASNAAFFSVTAPQGQPLTLSVLTGDTNLTAGGQPPIRYSTDGGATWQSYTAPFTVPAAGSGSVLVAVDITSEQDDLFEGQETFSLSATSGANSVSGDATINDDGTGTIIPVDADGDPTIINGNPVTDPDGPFDDDRAALSVTGGDYNEASNAAFFSVTAPQGQPLTLSVLTGDTNLTAGGQPPIRYSTDGGATWQSYTAPFTVPAAGSGSVLVAVDITSEQDDLFEGQETFSLSATSGANTVSGDATINDDGTGTIIPVDPDGDPTIDNGNPVTDPDGPFDDDRAALSVTGGDYNEASNAAFFSVTAPQGQPLTLTVVTGDTNLTAGGQPPIRYSTDGGATWQSYTAPFTVPAAGSGSVLVAVDITSEQDDLFEGQETFSLSATSGANSVSGDATINDDGTGTIIPVDADGDPTIINGNPVTDPDGPFDDDRAALSVTGGDYNEASNAAFFSVTAPQGQPLTLSVLTGDTNLTAGGQPPIRYSTDGGATWQSYTAPFTVPAAGSGSVLVAVDITSEQDDLFEGQETFSLSATSGANTVSGDATINDDGTGTIIPVDPDGDPTIDNGNPVTDPDGPFDDDRAAPTPAPAPAPAPAPTPTPTPTAEPDNDGIPSNTEEQLAAIISGDGDTNDDGIPDFQQAAIATLAWIDDVNFENAIAGDFAAVPKQSIITVQSIQQDGSLNNGTALQDIKVIAFEDVPVGAPTDVFVEWTPIQFALTGTTPGAALADVDNGRAGTQTTVLINNSAAGLPSNYFDRYYTYVSEEIIARYAAAGLQLRSLDGEILSNASQAGWYDFTQRSPGGDGGRYITKDGKIVGVEITFTDNAFGDDDPTSNRILDPSTLVLGPSPRFTLKTDSQEIGDRITGNGLPEVRMLGGPGEAAAITLVGADGVLLERDRHYSVREITVDGVRSVYAIQFLDADLAKAGAQSFGRYFTGQATGNNANTTDGTYTVLLNGEAAGSLQIRTNALSDRQRLKCLNNLDSKKSLESKLFGYRIENQRGTNSDDVLIGNGGNNKFNGGNGSDLINAFGERFAGNSINRSTDLNQRDLLTGGKSADYFQLGDLVGSFYVGDGRNGYARITDFSRGDRIVLTGSETDYTIKNASVGGQSGRGVFQGDDLVALIQGSASDSLRITNSNQVLFI